jgi:hypothetical protein
METMILLLINKQLHVNQPAGNYQATSQSREDASSFLASRACMRMHAS